MATNITKAINKFIPFCKCVLASQLSRNKNKNTKTQKSPDLQPLSIFVMQILLPNTADFKRAP